MKYKVVSGFNFISDVFDDLKKSPESTGSYLGKTVLSIYKEENGIAEAILYDPKKKEIIAACPKESSLLKKFHELTDKKLKLELK